MKKLFVMLCGLFLTAATTLVAQNAVNGTVTDKDGNPIPGVKVEIVGSNESVLTELDGTFQLNTRFPAKKVKVHYAGMQSKTQKIKPDMAIKMYNSSWWREKPEKYQWFVGPQITIVNNKKLGEMSYGLMFGRVKDIGWYFKGVWSPLKSTDETYETYVLGDELPWTTGKFEEGYIHATAGGMLRLWSPIYLFLGAGYSHYEIACEKGDYTWVRNDDYSYGGVCAEVGIMVKIKRFFLNAGVVFNSLEHDGMEHAMGNFGIGIYF